MMYIVNDCLFIDNGTVFPILFSIITKILLGFLTQKKRVSNKLCFVSRNNVLIVKTDVYILKSSLLTPRIINYTYVILEISNNWLYNKLKYINKTCILISAMIKAAILELLQRAGVWCKPV